MAIQYHWHNISDKSVSLRSETERDVMDRILLRYLMIYMTTFSPYRHKAGGSNGESILVSQLQHGLTLEFEHSDPLRRLRLALSELLAIMNKV